MKVILLAALMAAAAGAILVHPLMTAGKGRRTGWRVLAAFAAISLGLYLALGRPDLPGAPALFEKSDSRADQRHLTARVMELLPQLAADPDNKRIRLELGAAHYAIAVDMAVNRQNPEDALEPLDAALAVAPLDAPYLKALKNDETRLKAELKQDRNAR